MEIIILGTGKLSRRSNAAMMTARGTAPQARAYSPVCNNEPIRRELLSSCRNATTAAAK
jgi:hypothetical protein